MNTVQVLLDDRVRLMSAMMAATSWPDDEQSRKPHGTHAHARGTRKRLAPHDKHAAVLVLQALLDRNVSLSDIYGYMVQLSWPELQGSYTPRWVPPTWARHIKAFYEVSDLTTWWEDQTDIWDAAKRDAQKMFSHVDIHDFLEKFVGPFEDKMLFVPNVCYPTDQEVGVSVDGILCCIAPPRIAWGDNPPWPFDEDPTHIYRAALMQYGNLLMKRYLDAHPAVFAEASSNKLSVGKSFEAAHPTWESQFLALFGAGIVAIFLEDEVNEQEAKAYILMEKKAQGLHELPGVVSVLRRYLRGRDEGKYEDFAAYLPHFGKHLRVAKTITSL